MLTDPRELTLDTIDKLQLLAAYLEDESGGRVSTEPLSAHARRCKEALLTITTLLPKQRAVYGEARGTVPHAERIGMNCD